MITKQDIEKMGHWKDINNLEFDIMYIVPTTEKLTYEWFNSGYILGQIGEEIKIVNIYDGGQINCVGQQIQFDFQIENWIKMWKSWWQKLKYKHWYIIQ